MWGRLLVLGRDHDAVASEIRARLPKLDVRSVGHEDARPEDLADREMLLAFRVPAVLETSLQHLRWIQSTGAGVDGLLRGPLPEGVLLTRLVGVFGAPMAEHVLARCLAFTQRIVPLERERAARQWRPFFPGLLRGRRALVVGAGEIGGAIVRALAAVGMDVHAVTRSGRAVEGAGASHAAAALDELLPRAEFLVLVVPHTRETDGLMDARRLDLLPRGAFVVNVARGAVLDEDALVARLSSGRLGGAALDVFAVEPLPQDSPLWTQDRVLLSPHVAGVTSARDAAEGFCENWRLLEKGEEPRGRVDRSLGY